MSAFPDTLLLSASAEFIAGWQRERLIRPTTAFSCRPDKRSVIRRVPSGRQKPLAKRGLMTIERINRAVYARCGKYASMGYPRPSFPGASCSRYGTHVRVRHHNGDATIFSGHCSNAVRRTVRVSRIGLGHLTEVINVAQRHQTLLSS